MSERDYPARTTRQMRDKGWSLAPTRHPGEPSTCKQCGAEIEWWISPNNKSVPFDPCDRDSVPRTCHFETCSARRDSQPSTGFYRGSDIAALETIKQGIVAEYQHEGDGEAGYKSPEHKINWLYRKLCEARLQLARSQAGAR